MLANGDSKVSVRLVKLFSFYLISYKAGSWVPHCVVVDVAPVHNWARIRNMN